MSAVENNEDSKKRTLNSDSDELTAALINKRAALGMDAPTSSTSEEAPDDPELMLKVLIPNPMAGLLIGKLGSTINSMTETSGATIRLSANNVFYPGTNERLVLLSGTRDSIVSALEQITAKVAESFAKIANLSGQEGDKKEKDEGKKEKKEPVPDSVATKGPTTPKVSAPGSFEMKLLIPKPASGHMIGKNGCVVKRMSEASACKMQFGPDDDPAFTNERAVIIHSLTGPALVVGAATVALQLLNDERVRNYTNGTLVYNAPAPPAPALGINIQSNHPYGNAPLHIAMMGPGLSGMMMGGGMGGGMGAMGQMAHMSHNPYYPMQQQQQQMGQQMGQQMPQHMPQHMPQQQPQYQQQMPVGGAAPMQRGGAPSGAVPYPAGPGFPAHGHPQQQQQQQPPQHAQQQQPQQQMYGGQPPNGHYYPPQQGGPY